MGSNYGQNVCDLELEVVSYFERLWQGIKGDNHGSVVTSGTEGNINGLYLARETLPSATLFFSSETHYSVKKAARMLRINTCEVHSQEKGEIDYVHFQEQLKHHKPDNIILVANCGTTVKGAYDNIARLRQILLMEGYNEKDFYIHSDAALSGLILPFIEDAPYGITPNLNGLSDSISVSGHKMLGTPMPCGVFVARRAAVERISNKISYLRSSDTTIMGSRNGHSVLSIWYSLVKKGRTGLAEATQNSLNKANYLLQKLKSACVPTFCNNYSITVVFPAPPDEIISRYQLACESGLAHVVTMPSVSYDTIDLFIHDYCKWWRSENAKQAIEEGVV